MVVVAVPLIRSKVPAWKAWVTELVKSRKAEFQGFNRRMHLTKHHVWLSNGPQGPMAVVFHGGPGAKTFLPKLSESQHPFDVWFRDRISEYHGIDFSKPVDIPAPQLLLDWNDRTPAEPQAPGKHRTDRQNEMTAGLNRKPAPTAHA